MKTNIPIEKDFFGAVGCKMLCANFEGFLPDTGDSVARVNSVIAG